VCFDWCSQRRYKCCDAPLSVDANENGLGGVGLFALICDGGESWESVRLKIAEIYTRMTVTHQCGVMKEKEHPCVR
jgi:hypothetical protein